MKNFQKFVDAGSNTLNTAIELRKGMVEQTLSEDERLILITQCNEAFAETILIGLEEFLQPTNSDEDKSALNEFLGVRELAPNHWCDPTIQMPDWLRVVSFVRVNMLYNLFPLNATQEIDGKCAWTLYTNWTADVMGMSPAVSVDDPSKLGGKMRKPPLWWRALRVLLTPVRVWKKFYRGFAQPVEE